MSFIDSEVFHSEQQPTEAGESPDRDWETIL